MHRNLNEWLFPWYKILLALWRFGNRSYHFQTAYSLKQNKTQKLRKMSRTEKKHHSEFFSVYELNFNGDSDYRNVTRLIKFYIRRKSRSNSSNKQSKCWKIYGKFFLILIKTGHFPIYICEMNKTWKYGYNYN